MVIIINLKELLTLHVKTRSSATNFDDKNGDAVHNAVLTVKNRMHDAI